VFFLTPSGTLRPLAIELTRPPMDGKPQWKEVRMPSWDATGIWLWRLAKAHVLAHDSGYHQLVSHWYVCMLQFTPTSVDLYIAINRVV
jgi:lipoxygenase